MSERIVTSRLTISSASVAPSTDPAKVFTASEYTGGTDATIDQITYANTMAVEYGRCSFAMIQPFASHTEYMITRYAACSIVVSGPHHGRTTPLRSVALKTYQMAYPIAIARMASHLCSLIWEVE